MKRILFYILKITFLLGLYLLCVTTGVIWYVGGIIIQSTKDLIEDIKDVEL